MVNDFFAQQRIHAWADTNVGLPPPDEEEEKLAGNNSSSPSKTTVDPAGMSLESANFGGGGEQELTLEKGIGSPDKDPDKSSRMGTESGKVDENDLAAFIYGDAFDADL